MRYVKGRSLAEVLKEDPLPNRRAAALMEQVARAVQAVHDEGVLHRDLKPHNVLVDAQGRPYVSDFGLAKWMGAADSPTQAGQVLGSPEYMSPEQAEDASQVSEATDVYGLGATLYALLTGRPPFQGETVADILHQVKYREPVPPRSMNPAVSRDLNTITLKCLEKDPDRRFGSAREVANELKRYLEGRPIRTRPVGPAGRLWRWSHRNPVVAALSAAAVILISLAGAAYWKYRSTKAAADIAKKAADEREAETKWAQDEESYLKDMPRAQRHLEAGERAKTRELLAQWRPGAGEAGHRGWEWYLLDAFCN
jgi:serine/threonine protein kinase